MVGNHKAARVIAAVLRVVTAAAAGVAAVVMSTSEETSSPFGFPLEAKFQYTPALVFFVAANAIACAYNLVALVVPPASPAARFVLMADVMVGMLLGGAIGAAAAISDVGKNGNSHAAWPAICGLVETFCAHVGGALISGLVAVILTFMALMYSIYYYHMVVTKQTTEQSP